MDSEHEVFIQGIEQERRLEVTFFCRKRRREIVSSCAPLHYSKGTVSDTDAENEQERYYLWDYGAKKDSNFLFLSPSEIISMKLTDDVFHTHEFYSPGKQAQILNT
jgi:hypothetical protein